MSLPRYGEYRDSGAEWLGAIPSHWEAQPCRYFVVEQTEKNENAESQAYLSLMANVGIIPYEEKGDVGNKKPEDLSKCKLVSKGDLVINSMNYGIGSYGLSDLSGVCSPVYIVLRPLLDRVKARFAFRIFENKAFQTYAQSFGNGILEHRAAINWDILKGIRVGLPPIEEQEAILCFLDRETAKIDTLIAEQERLMALLAEKRQATISHAVTKGLNPNVPMKGSGVAWLGEVPSHWETWKLRHAFGCIASGTTPPSDETHWYSDGTVPWITTGELREEEIFATSKMVTTAALQQFSSLRLYPKGSLAIAMYGATIGRLGILGVESTTNQACCVLSHPTSLAVRFVFYWLISAKQSIIEQFATGGGQPNINQDVVSSLKIPAPGLAEQAAIVTFLDDETRRLDALRLKAERVIALLRERRSALIAAAVTGQIDVRNVPLR